MYLEPRDTTHMSTPSTASPFCILFNQIFLYERLAVSPRWDIRLLKAEFARPCQASRSITLYVCVLFGPHSRLLHLSTPNDFYKAHQQLLPSTHSDSLLGRMCALGFIPLRPQYKQVTGNKITSFDYWC